MRRIVDIDQAEALGIAAVPLKIVGQRPVEKAADVCPFTSSVKRKKIAVQKIDPIRVVDLPVQEYVVVAAQSALRHIERQPVAFIEERIPSRKTA